MNYQHKVKLALVVIACSFGFGQAANFEKFSLAQSVFNDPRDISGSVFWLDGSDVDGDFKPGGAFLDGVRWADKSAAKNASVKQTNLANLPAVIAAGPNGATVVRFDGNDFMDANSESFGMLANVQGATLFAVVKPTAATSQRLLMISTNQSRASRAGVNLFDNFGTNIAGRGNYGLAGRRLDSDPFQRIEGGAISLGEWGQFTGVFDYANKTVTLFARGKQETTTTNFQSAGATSPTPSANIRVGADADLNDVRGTVRGDVAELIVYNRALLSGEREQVESYLIKKWFP